MARRRGEPSADGRSRAVATAARLFQRQGFHGTGLMQIIEESGAPRGSFYFYFPRGKEQLAEEAVRLAGDQFAELMARVSARTNDPAEFVVGVARALARWLERSEFTEGCPVATVTLETTPASEPLRQAAEEAYRVWQHLVEKELIASGIARDRAPALATLVVTAFEGALLLCRTRKSIAPLESVGRELGALVDRESRARARSRR